MNIYQEDAAGDAAVEITIEQLEEYRESCREVIEIADAAANLKNNPDFKKVIMQGYIEKEPARLGALIASGRMPPNTVDAAIADLKSIGSLVTYLNDQVQKGQIAADELANAEAAYDATLEAEAE